MRPEFHFAAERGWINDPHAITFRQGRYHVFYQYVPSSMIWRPDCHWGHSVGSDLVSLQPRGIALAPGEGDDGVWTGTLVDAEGLGVRIFYTSTVTPDLDAGRIRVARPNDDRWDTWTKDDGVLLRTPRDLDVTRFRDPFVFRDDEGWQMLVGASLRDGTAAAIGYTSTDLDLWTCSGVAASRSSSERDPEWMGSLWECPQLFEIEGRHVLLTSVWDDGVLHCTGYGIGRWSNGRFVADVWGRLSHGRSYYAASYFRDEDGRPCLTFWMRGVRDEEEGWSGAHSLPHVLTLDGDRLVATPHPHLDRYAGPPIPAGAVIDGQALDIRWSPAQRDRLVVRHGGRETLRIETGGGPLVVFGAGDAATMPYRGGPLRLVLDGPTAELSCADGVLGAGVSAARLPVEVLADHAEPEVRLLAR